MARLEAQTVRRSENVAVLTCLLEQIEGVEPLATDELITTHAHHLYLFRYRAEEMSRDRFLEALRAEGIPCASGYRPLYGEATFATHFADYPLTSAYFGGQPDYRGVCCPVTERVCVSESVWLTQNMLLEPTDDMRNIATAIAKIFAAPKPA